MSISKDATTTTVASIDALFGQEIIATCPMAQLPKLRSLKQLKQICHNGVSSQLRCSVWIVSAMRVVKPHLPIVEIEAYGTTSLTTIIESAWKHALNATFANGIDREEIIAPDFGLHQSVLDRLIQCDYRTWNPNFMSPIPAEGVRSLVGVLCCLHQVLGIEHCPLLPDISEL
jgi:hypothetical protein